MAGLAAGRWHPPVSRALPAGWLLSWRHVRLRSTACRAGAGSAWPGAGGEENLGPLQCVWTALGAVPGQVEMRRLQALK